MPIQAKLIGSLILVIAIFASGWIARGWKEGATREAALSAEKQAYLEAANYMESVAQKVERDNAAFRANWPEVVKIIDRPVYKQHCVDDAGLRLLQKASGVSGQSDGQVPGNSSAPKGHDGG